MNAIPHKPETVKFIDGWTRNDAAERLCAQMGISFCYKNVDCAQIRNDPDSQIRPMAEGDDAKSGVKYKQTVKDIRSKLMSVPRHLFAAPVTQPDGPIDGVGHKIWDGRHRKAGAQGANMAALTAFVLAWDTPPEKARLLAAILNGQNGNKNEPGVLLNAAFLFLQHCLGELEQLTDSALASLLTRVARQAGVGPDELKKEWEKNFALERLLEAGINKDAIDEIAKRKSMVGLVLKGYRDLFDLSGAAGADGAMQRWRRFAVAVSQAFMRGLPSGKIGACVRDARSHCFKVQSANFEDTLEEYLSKALEDHQSDLDGGAKVTGLNVREKENRKLVASLTIAWEILRKSGGLSGLRLLPDRHAQVRRLAADIYGSTSEEDC